jgi:hypothetical protein
MEVEIAKVMRFDTMTATNATAKKVVVNTIV